MILVLCLCILLLITFVMRLLMKLRQQEKVFRYTIKSLQDRIAEMSLKQAKNQERLLLVDEFNQSLKSIHAQAYTSIFELNGDLFEVLAKNNLLQ